MLEKDPCKRITIPEIKAHDFFGAIDWDQVAQRSTKDKKSFQYGVGSSPNEPPIDIPSSEAYKQGQVPFPWFEYASPVLYKAVQGSPLFNEDSPSKFTSVNNDIHGKTTPVKLVRRLKGIWSRSPKSPDVEAL
ncbi:hypothetical protein PHLCEN_2v1040 [Hermanssonia centrifuga]|uniref:Uncharacterized protein n=1 Tax=Hermanssonia centrifuga TaxID=98765 RepID=A0A2R6S4F2_9APHY|nr:hypothetical protein PHLCEN_2v1040 [Hermanssonia centrifuga]